MIKLKHKEALPIDGLPRKIGFIIAQVFAAGAIYFALLSSAMTATSSIPNVNMILSIS